MLEVKFYDEVDDSLLKFAVIVAKHENKWVFCKHKDRETFEIPGGHREDGENIDDTAKRELWEETGAKDFTIKPVCVYSVQRGEEESFGKLYFADVKEFEKLPTMEIEKIELFSDLPENLTYPLIQPKLWERVKNEN